MKRLMAGTVILVVMLWSASAAQELNIGPTVGALFAPGGRGFGPDPRGVNQGMGGRDAGASALLGFEAVYSLPTVPFDLVGQFSFSSINGDHGRGDSLAAPAGGYYGGRWGLGGNLFSAGLGGRWVPVDGPIAPYLGVTLLLTVEQAQRGRPDSALATVQPPPDPAGNGRDFRGFGERRGGTNLGIGFSGGSAFDISRLLRLDVEATYNLIAPFARGGERSALGLGVSLLFRVL
jgi:hypothetical protein